MEHEVEAGGLASVGGLDGGTHHPVEAGVLCRNCGTPIEVRFCSNCGQLGTDFHRPVWDLVSSSVADMFSLDGRLWKSLPLLMFRPGRMTRAYIDGKRARFVPPFRLFLLSSVIFFLTLFTTLEHQPWLKEMKFTPGDQPQGEFVVMGDQRFKIAGEQDRAALEAELARTDLTPERRAQLEQVLEGAGKADSVAQMVIREDGTVDREALRASVAEASPELTPAQLATAQATAERFANFYENQERFGTRLKEWAPRFTLLFLPIFSMLLAVSYAWHRKRYFYDHLITGLHFQTYVHILATVLILASVAWPVIAPFAGGLSFVIVFIYLMRMLRVTYDTGHILSFLRAFVLLIAALVALSLLAAGLVALSFFLT
jgi:hypothetical protein